MAWIRSTNYAPDIYKSLNGIILAYKPARLSTLDLVHDLKERLSDSLNEFLPRPLTKRLVITGDVDEDKEITEVNNLADHPLVVGPRYTPSEINLNATRPYLGFRSSGLVALCIGSGNKFFLRKINNARLVSVYHITGKFGFITDTFFSDGKITDKFSYKYIKPGRFDSILARIESQQYERMFDSANVEPNSQEAYKLALSWPARPPKMASWPVIYRIRCIHFDLPEFKIEVTVGNENENFLAQLSQDIGTMLRSGAYTESIRRVKFGPFDVHDSLTEKDWDLQSIVNHLNLYNRRHAELHQILRQHFNALQIKTEHNPTQSSQIVTTN